MKLKKFKKSIKTIVLFIIILIILILIIFILQASPSKKRINLITKLNRKNNLEYNQPPKLDRKYIAEPRSIYSTDSASRFLNKGLGLSKTSEKFDLQFQTKANIDSPIINGKGIMENDQVQWIFSLKEYSTNNLISQGFYITQMDAWDYYKKVETKWNINKKIEKNKKYYITLSLKSALGAHGHKNSILPGIHNLNSTEWHGEGDNDILFINDKKIVEWGKFKDLLFNEKTNSNLKNNNIILKDLTFSWDFIGTWKPTWGGIIKEGLTFGLVRERHVTPAFRLNNKKEWTANYNLKGDLTYLSQIEVEEALKNIFTINTNSTQEKNLKNNRSFWLDKNTPPELSIGLNNNIFKAYEEKKWGKELKTKIINNFSYSESIRKVINKAIDEGKINKSNWTKIQIDINNNSFNENELEAPFWAIFLSEKAPKINNQNIIEWLMSIKQIGYYPKISERKENYELLSLYLNNAKNIKLKLFKEYGDREIPFIIPINKTNLLEAKIPLENKSQKTFEPSIKIDGYVFEYKGLNESKNNIKNIKPKVYEDLGKYGINYNSANYTYKAFYQPNTIDIDGGVWFYPIESNARKYDWELKQINRIQEVIDLKNNSFIKYLLKIAKNKLSHPISYINDFDSSFPEDLKSFFFTKDGKKFKIKSFQRIKNKYLAIGNIEIRNRNQDFVLLLNGEINENIPSINFNNILANVKNYINQKTISVDGITTNINANIPTGVVSNPHEYINNNPLTKAQYNSLPSNLKNKFSPSSWKVKGSTTSDLISSKQNLITKKIWNVEGIHNGIKKPKLPKGIKINNTIWNNMKIRTARIRYDGGIMARGRYLERYGPYSQELKKFLQEHKFATNIKIIKKKFVDNLMDRRGSLRSWSDEHYYEAFISYELPENWRSFQISGKFEGTKPPNLPLGINIIEIESTVNGITKDASWFPPRGLSKITLEYKSHENFSKSEYNSLPSNLKNKFSLYSNKWHGQYIKKQNYSLPSDMSYEEKSWNIKIDNSTPNLWQSLSDYIVYSNELEWIDKPNTKVIKRDNQTLERAYSSFIYQIKNKEKNIEKQFFYKPKIPKDKNNPYDLTTWILSSDKSITLNDYLKGRASPESKTFNLDNVTYVVNKNLIMIINPYQRQTTFNNVNYYDQEASWKINKVVNFKDGKEEVLADFENHKLSNTFNKAFSMTRTGHPTTQGLLTNGDNNIFAKMKNFKDGKTKYKILIDTKKPVPIYQNLNKSNKQLYFKENDIFYNFYTSTKPIEINWIEKGIKRADVSWVDSNGTWYKKPINVYDIKNGEDFNQKIDLIADYQGLYKIEYVDIAGNYKKDFLWIQKKENNNKNYIAYGEYPENLLIADTIYNNKRTIWFDSQSKKDLIVKNVLTDEIEIKMLNKKTGKMEKIHSPNWITYQKQDLKSIGSTIDSGQQTFSLAGDELNPLINGDPSITRSKSINKFKEARIKVPYDSYIELKLKTNIFYQDQKKNFQPFYSYLNVLNSNKYDFNKYKKFQASPFEITEAIGIGKKQKNNIYLPNKKENNKVKSTLKNGWIKVPTKFDTGIIKKFTRKVKVNYSKLYYNWYNEIKYLDSEEIFLKKEGKYKIEVIDKNNHKTIYKFLVFNYPRNFSKYVVNSSKTEKIKDKNGKLITKKVIKTEEFFKYPAIASIQDKSVYHLKGDFLNFDNKPPKWSEGLNLKTKSYFYDFRVKKTAKNLNELKNWLAKDLKNNWIKIDPINNPVKIKDKNGKEIELLEFIVYGKGKTNLPLNNFDYQAILNEIDDQKAFTGTPQGIPSNIKIKQIKDSSTKLSDQKLKATAYWEGKYIDVYKESNQLPELLIDHDNNDVTPKVHLYEDYDHYQNYLSEWLAHGGTKADFFKSKSNPLSGDGGKDNIIKSINKEKSKRKKQTSQKKLPNNKKQNNTKTKEKDQQIKKPNSKNNSNIGGKKIGIIFGGLFGGLGTIGILSFILYKRYKKGFGKIKNPKKRGA